MFFFQDMESNISEVHSIEDETFDNIVIDTLNFVEKFNIKYIFIYLCGNNRNAHFGRLKHNDNINVLAKLRNLWTKNELGVGFSEHNS